MMNEYIITVLLNAGLQCWMQDYSDVECSVTSIQTKITVIYTEITFIYSEITYNYIKITFTHTEIKPQTTQKSHPTTQKWLPSIQTRSLSQEKNPHYPHQLTCMHIITSIKQFATPHVTERISQGLHIQNGFLLQSSSVQTRFSKTTDTIISPYWGFE